MSYNKAILLLGTNLGNKELNIEKAKELIAFRGYPIVKQTDVIKTEPVGFTSNNCFLNQIICVESRVSPQKMLRDMKEIESEMGRVYEQPLDGEQYTDRLIDIDILKIDEIIYKSETLIIPHPRNFNRKYVNDLLIML
ncbi:2-amino-4-hydroxy-6-hydroxymethyldihydropteridine diphosphokinase [Vaginella massiliensis]|uniref:2-amino-4-hydroxy-6- hydroxymethyldihydropteridine diphosphokinase n=1 Tax=Vaginella massiliensis TaxID=1816680 RepID=UPI003750EBC5